MEINELSKMSRDELLKVKALNIARYIAAKRLYNEIEQAINFELRRRPYLPDIWHKEIEG